MPVTDIKPTYPALDAVAAALEEVFGNSLKKDSGETWDAWMYYRELLPTVVNGKSAVSNKLRINAGRRRPLDEVVARSVMRGIKKSDASRDDRVSYIKGFIEDPLKRLCNDADFEFARPDGSSGLVKRLFDEGKIYDLLECDPYRTVDDDDRAVNEEARLSDRIVQRLRASRYSEKEIRRFAASTNELYKKMEADYESLANDKGDEAAGRSDAVISAGREILGAILKFAISGALEAGSPDLPETLDQRPEDDAWYSNPDMRFWSLTELRGEGANATPVNVWEFDVGESVAFGREWIADSQDEITPCHLDADAAANVADANKAYAVKTLPVESHVSRRHAVISSGDGPTFVIHDKRSSCGTMVERGEERFYLGGNPRIAARIGSLRGTEFEGIGNRVWESVELKPGDLITIALKVDLDESDKSGRKIVGVGPFEDSIVLKLTTA